MVIAVHVLSYGAVIIVEDFHKINHRSCVVVEHKYALCIQHIYNPIVKLSREWINIICSQLCSKLFNKSIIFYCD